MLRALGKKMSNEEHLRKAMTGKDKKWKWGLCYLFNYKIL